MQNIVARYPIGVIDSGVGGLTVLVRLLEKMPDQPFIFLADQAWCPYGSRPAKKVEWRVRRLVDYLLKQGCREIVLACNTATAAAIEQLRSSYKNRIKFVGMEPAVKPAAQNSETQHIGVLATQGTLAGSLFQRTAASCTRVQIHKVVGEGLVELIEEGKAETQETQQLLQKLLDPLLTQNIDQLVLGCTHYPLLRPVLKKILPQSVKIIDPATAVAEQALRVRNQIDAAQLHSPSTATARLRLLTTRRDAQLRTFAQKVFECYKVPYPINTSEEYLQKLDNRSFSFTEFLIQVRAWKNVLQGFIKRFLNFTAIPTLIEYLVRLFKRSSSSTAHSNQARTWKSPVYASCPVNTSKKCPARSSKKSSSSTERSSQARA